MFSMSLLPTDRISERFQSYGGSFRHNLFFALVPPSDAVAEIAIFGETACGAHGFRGKPIWPDRLHLTLLAVEHEDWELAEILRRAQCAAERVRIAPFEVTLDTAESVDVHKNSFPFVLRCRDDQQKILGLRRSLVRELKQEGFENLSRRLPPPHVTWMWADHMVDEYPIAPIVWTACEFVLVLSYVGRSLHEHIGYWPLGGRGGQAWLKASRSMASKTATR